MLRRQLLSKGALLSTGAVLALGGLALAPATADAAGLQGKGLLINGVTGRSGTPGSGAGLNGTFKGRVLIQRLSFNQATGRLRVHGLLSGSTVGGIVGSPSRSFAAQPFTAVARLTGAEAEGAARAAACSILNLDIGRITLNLLGLVIDIAPIAIDITAIPGGGLLGDLLCALAGLLNPLGALAAILALLRRLNDLLASARTVLNLVPG